MIIKKGVRIYGGGLAPFQFEAGTRILEAEKLRRACVSVPLQYLQCPNTHENPSSPPTHPSRTTCRFPCGTKHRTHVLHTCQFPCVQLLRALFETFKRKRQLNITT